MIGLASTLIDQKHKNYKIMRIFWIRGLLGTTFITVLVLLATIRSPWFSWLQHALGDLGVSEVAFLFNVSGFIGGLLNLIFSYGIKEYQNKETKNHN